jgi:hypothetical protein
MSADPRALLDLLPPIKRARGFWLYSSDGRRFLDFFQEGGKAVLGARGASVNAAMKAELDAGRACALPSLALSRARRELARLFPGRGSFEAFPSEREARESLLALGPAIGRAEWRPFLPEPETEAMVVIPPLPSSVRPAFVLFRGERPSGFRADLPPASFQVAAAIKALAALRREEAEGAGARVAGWKAFDRASGGLFIREGPYIVPASTADYAGLFVRFLTGGALLSPDPARPSVIPGDFNPGALSFLKETRA